MFEPLKWVVRGKIVEEDPPQLLTTKTSTHHSNRENVHELQSKVKVQSRW